MIKYLTQWIVFHLFQGIKECQVNQLHHVGLPMFTYCSAVVFQKSLINVTLYFKFSPYIGSIFSKFLVYYPYILARGHWTACNWHSKNIGTKRVRRGLKPPTHIVLTPHFSKFTSFGLCVSLSISNFLRNYHFKMDQNLFHGNKVQKL